MLNGPGKSGVCLGPDPDNPARADADTLRMGLPDPLQVRDQAGRAVHVGGRQLRGSRRRQSRWRELPNMISSQEGTEARLPRADLRL